MEAYPPQYTEHNLPLVVLTGLGERPDDLTTGPAVPRLESGTKFSCNSPDCEGERATNLLQQFLRLDGQDAAWNSQALSGPAGVLKYSMKAIGRSYTLPPRKAAPLPQEASSEGAPTLPMKTELHSPLSPLSPGSPIFPDALFTPLWFSKHQQQVPCLFLAFFDIVANDASKDEQIKADINIIRTSLSRSGFKTRFAAVLLSDKSILQASDLEERLSSIRRLTSLDSKTGLFFMPPMSSNSEIATFVQSIMTTLQPLCAEHYRELTKHARRKKARGGPPPSAPAQTGAGSQSLTTSGWNTRYEVKQGVFAELRQEMDVAERHYTAAIDELFSSEGIFEATASWSPRWEEARLLCDALAIRTIRCQLWVSQTTGAVLSWINYKDRMRDLLDRRGKGSETYGWAAWEARWAEIMAQLINRADLAVQGATSDRTGEDGEGTMQFHMAPEKSFAAAERLRPFQMLHHSGYWLRLALDGIRERQKRALAIPDEDRVAPGKSPASAVANRVRNYDLYLVPDPHEEAQHDHVADVARLTKLATEQFEIKGQGRMMEILKFELAKDLVGIGRFQEASDILVPLWESSSWRQEDWHSLFGELVTLLQKCAAAENLSDTAIMVATTYESLSRTRVKRDNASLDTCLDRFDPLPRQPVQLRYRDNERISPVGLNFAFESGESHVGETLECQVTISSRAKYDAALSLSDVLLHFGPSRTVKIIAANGDVPAKDASDSLTALGNVEDTDGSLQGTACLHLRPSQKRTFSFQLALREAGSLRLTEMSFAIRNDKFEIEHAFREDAIIAADAMLVHSGDNVQRRHLPRTDTTSVLVLPKPPKVKLLLHGLHKKYYTDELVTLSLEVENDEIDAVSGKLTADARDNDQPIASLAWAVGPDGDEARNELVHTEMSNLEAGASRRVDLQVRAPSDPVVTRVTIEFDYTLSSDSTTPLKKTFVLEMSFVTPFEAQYNFGPILYAGRWPSFFDPETGNTADQPGGIPQLWRLSSQVRSLAVDNLVVHGMEIVKEHIHGDSTCSLRDIEQAEKQTLAPGEITDETFQLRTQKHSLDDRRPTTLESSLLVTWSRDEASPAFTTSLPVPRLTLPVSEPRVLCTLASAADTFEEMDVMLHYHIENPSTHFLTFAITMEASEDFAFCGPKYRTLSLAPLSRHGVKYGLTLYDDAVEPKDGGRWIWPALQVVDSYYQKSLKVHAAGPDVKMDAKGEIGVWIEM